MSEMGSRIARKRKELGMTQNIFAEKLNVTRQTVSRWEAGTVMPDIDKIADISEILNVTCDYLLKDNVTEEEAHASGAFSRLLKEAEGKSVRLNFFDEEADPDLYNVTCRIIAFEGNWMKIGAETKKGRVEKLIPLSSVLSIEITEEDA